MFAILDRYLLSEVLKTFGAVMLVLLLVMTANSFIRLLSDVSAGGIAVMLVMDFLGLQVLKVLPTILPPAFFFSMLYALGRLHRDNEMTAIRASGIGNFRIFRSFWIPIFLLSAFTAWLTFEAVPWSVRKMDNMKFEQRDTSELAGMVAGKFNEYSKGDLVFYIERLSDDKQRMENIFIQNRQHGTIGIVSAKSAYQYTDEKTGDIFVVLENGYRYEGSPGQEDFRYGNFAEYGIRISNIDKGRKKIRTRGKTTDMLLEDPTLKNLSEYHYRLGFPVAVILLGLLSIPLSYTNPRQSMYGRLFIAVLVYFSYGNLMSVGSTWIENGVMPAPLGLWWLHGGMIVLAFLLLGSDAGFMKRIRRRLK